MNAGDTDACACLNGTEPDDSFSPLHDPTTLIIKYQSCTNLPFLFQRSADLLHHFVSGCNRQVLLSFTSSSTGTYQSSLIKRNYTVVSNGLCCKVHPNLQRQNPGKKKNHTL
ncbi:hypothetical protein QQ045_027194 [Rhodiola kirilowii]